MSAEPATRQPSVQLSTQRPSAGPVEGLLDEIWAEAARRDEGSLATYIPELARVDPSVFGLAMATLDGRVYTAGTITPFTIQSVSKPFAYALALADRGVAEVLTRVGVEPTGNPFNSIGVDALGRPHNPMVNAGAIVTTSLLAGTTRAEQEARMLTGLSAFAGRELSINEEVFASEQSTGDRNRAIAYLLRSVEGLDADVEGALEIYFRQCSVEVTARDLAVMAATLANSGVNPVTGETVVPAEVVSRVVTVMSTCGMYDFAGEWLYRVGLPAKSGVSGGIAALQPGRVGLGAHSPLIDPRGNSVRGVAACELLSQRMDLHVFAASGADLDRTHRVSRGDVRRSQRARAAAQVAALDAHGGQIALREINGDQDLASAERLVRAVIEDSEQTRWLVLDLRRVRRFQQAAVNLLVRLVEHLRAADMQVVVVPARSVAARRAAKAVGAVVNAELTDVDSALGWCEDRLLDSLGVPSHPPDTLVPLTGQDLLAGLSPEELERLEAVIETRLFTAGAYVFSAGDPADALYLIGAGQVSAVLRRPGAPPRRISSMGPGSAFGELAFVDGSPRSVSVVADEPTLCHVLTREAFATLIERHPAVAAAVHRAIATTLAARLRRSTREVAVLEGYA